MGAYRWIAVHGVTIGAGSVGDGFIGVRLHDRRAFMTDHRGGRMSWDGFERVVWKGTGEVTTREVRRRIVSRLTTKL